MHAMKKRGERKYRAQNNSPFRVEQRAMTLSRVALQEREREDVVGCCCIDKYQIRLINVCI